MDRLGDNTYLPADILLDIEDDDIEELKHRSRHYQEPLFDPSSHNIIPGCYIRIAYPAMS